MPLGAIVASYFQGILFGHGSYHLWSRAVIFQSIADLNEHLPVLDKNEQDGSVVFLLGADFPSAEDADSIILDGGISLHLRENGNNDLVSCGAFKVSQLPV